MAEPEAGDGESEWGSGAFCFLQLLPSPRENDHFTHSV